MFLVNFKAFLRFQFANQFVFVLLFQDHQFAAEENIKKEENVFLFLRS